MWAKLSLWRAAMSTYMRARVAARFSYKGVVLSAVLINPRTVKGGVGFKAHLLAHQQVAPVAKAQLGEAAAGSGNLIAHAVGETQELAGVHFVAVDVGAVVVFMFMK